VNDLKERLEIIHQGLSLLQFNQYSATGPSRQHPGAVAVAPVHRGVDDVATLALLYTAVGVAHWLVRRPMLALSFGGRDLGGPRVLAWDAVFYASFALVVTSSVRVAGVLLVFAFLVVPAAIAALLVRGLTRRLLLGWLVGAGVSAAGLVASYRWDLPTGAAIVSAFGGALALTAAALGARASARAVRARGLAALRPGALALAALVALAGLLLILVPAMDHLWLDAVERAAPSVQEAFLTPGERAARHDAVQHECDDECR